MKKFLNFLGLVALMLTQATNRLLRQLSSNYDKFFDSLPQLHWILFIGALLLAVEGLVLQDFYNFWTSLAIATLCCPLLPSSIIPGLPRYASIATLISLQFV